MSEHKVIVRWKRTSEDFNYETYSRDHEVEFEGGIKINASAAPSFKGNAAYVDPEEAFVGALSSCHMLTFLAVAAYKKIIIDQYDDQAVGYLEKNAEGKMVVKRVELNPVVKFSGNEVPDQEAIKLLHEKAHQQCFIANSVKTEVTVNT
ncbi:MAG: OsmC family protein [Candidatus Omnitrophica bacterium]|nr:OsmC family protein [Candidatus Omnitrophota bacterium]